VNTQTQDVLVRDRTARPFRFPVAASNVRNGCPISLDEHGQMWTIYPDGRMTPTIADLVSWDEPGRAA
jgi:hypothetical protein